MALSGCKTDAIPPENGQNQTATTTAAGPPREPVRTVAAGAAPDARPIIVCFGDSLTAGYGADPGQSYPDDLQERLDAAGYRYRVVNAGVSGNTTKDGLERLPRVVARRPATVVLEFGGNDGLRGLPLAQTEQNLAAMIQALQGAGAKVALAGITLPPQYGPEYIARFNAMYPALAKRFRVPFLAFLLQDVYGTAGDMQADGIHATAQGNRQVAVNVQKLIAPLLQRGSPGF